MPARCARTTLRIAPWTASRRCRRAVAHRDPDLVLAPLGELRAAALAVRAAASGVEVAGAVDVAEARAAAARAGAAGRQATRAASDLHPRALHAGQRLLDVDVLREPLRQARASRLLPAERAEDAGVEDLLAKDVLAALRDDGVLLLASSRPTLPALSFARFVWPSFSLLFDSAFSASRFCCFWNSTAWGALIFTTRSALSASGGRGASFPT